MSDAAQRPSADDLAERLEQAQDKIFMLTEVIEQLKAQLIDKSEGFNALAIQNKLTRAQTTILRLLFRRRLVTKEMIFVALYAEKPDRDWFLGDKTIEVHICKIRKQLPANSIECVWGRGYCLTDSGRAWVKQELEASNGRAD